MLLVHVLPMLAGAVLSLKNLNTFTFYQLFGAPWTGPQQLRGDPFDSSNPLNDGFAGAVWNTARLHVRSWRARSAADSRSRCCSIATCAGRSGRAR